MTCQLQNKIKYLFFSSLTYHNKLLKLIQFNHIKLLVLSSCYDSTTTNKKITPEHYKLERKKKAKAKLE